VTRPPIKLTERGEWVRELAAAVCAFVIIPCSGMVLFALVVR
jgi:hypothetical protein